VAQTKTTTNYYLRWRRNEWKWGFYFGKELSDEETKKVLSVLDSISISTSIIPEKLFCLDCETWKLSISNDLNDMELSWQSSPPPEWRPIIELVQLMREMVKESELKRLQSIDTRAEK
jgi:hypothetical protein